jgi:hypothetical protein
LQFKHSRPPEEAVAREYLRRLLPYFARGLAAVWPKLFVEQIAGKANELEKYNILSTVPYYLILLEKSQFNQLPNIYLYSLHLQLTRQQLLNHIMAKGG